MPFFCNEIHIIELERMVLKTNPASHVPFWNKKQKETSKNMCAGAPYAVVVKTILVQLPKRSDTKNASELITNTVNAPSQNNEQQQQQLNQKSGSGAETKTEPIQSFGSANILHTCV